jgi:hypothetical protein
LNETGQSIQAIVIEWDKEAVKFYRVINGFSMNELIGRFDIAIRLAYLFLSHMI